jgi:hypothetical protein
LRISIPEAIRFFTQINWDEFQSRDEFYKAYWSLNDAYVFCEGYSKLGWTPDDDIESWLAEYIIAFVLREYPREFDISQCMLNLEKDGSICRLPTDLEKKMW